MLKQVIYILGKLFKKSKNTENVILSTSLVILNEVKNLIILKRGETLHAIQNN